ncbi:hypothetical protein HPB47_026821 [Ixodes persulcatus]|uniref:Uncharacterized protein n=1 Tax=Ixodes persulcatus TaxID=34615 RepID=A0AC60PY14_IXOPE|nr:hypothetical protein HPB47_026821 [Ixodes persulcatus]
MITTHSSVGGPQLPGKIYQAGHWAGQHYVDVLGFRLPPLFPDDALQAVLEPYGKTFGVSHTTYKYRPALYTATRVVRIEKKNAVPNFINVAGHRVMCEAYSFESSLSSPNPPLKRTIRRNDLHPRNRRTQGLPLDLRFSVPK